MLAYAAPAAAVRCAAAIRRARAQQHAVTITAAAARGTPAPNPIHRATPPALKHDVPRQREQSPCVGPAASPGMHAVCDSHQPHEPRAKHDVHEVYAWHGHDAFGEPHVQSLGQRKYGDDGPAAHT